VNHPALNALQKMREILDTAFTPNSAFRSPAHNARSGGTAGSMHLLGRAFDIPIKKGMSREQIHAAGRTAGFTGFGDYDTFIHVDTGAPRYWDFRTKKG